MYFTSLYHQLCSLTTKTGHNTTETEEDANVRVSTFWNSNIVKRRQGAI